MEKVRELLEFRTLADLSGTNPVKFLEARFRVTDNVVSSEAPGAGATTDARQR
jgi:hypothetical protein